MKRLAFTVFSLCLDGMQRSSTPIKKIIDNPRDYDGKMVTVSGEVTESFSLLVVKYFVVDDGTGTITSYRALPKEWIRVKGKVSEMFSLGG
jgi:hypothetical protein